MRFSGVLSIVVVHLTLVSCTQQVPAPAQQQQPTPLAAECVADDAPATSNKCPNLLPDGWRAYTSQNSINDLVVKLREMRPSGAVPNVDVLKQRRKAAVECRKDATSNEGRTVDVVYFRPRGMSNFPSAGTQSRDLVVGIFMADIDESCPEARYGMVRKHGGWDRLVQFTAVRSRKAVPAGPQSRDDIVIGEWQSWAIETKGGKYRFHELRRGAYVRCGFRHGSQYGHISFIECDDARKLHEQAASDPAVLNAAEPGAVERAFATLIATYNQGDKEWRMRQLLNGDPFEAPAWGQCGNLGCCASE